MRIRFGYEWVYDCPETAPMILMLHAHPSRIHDLLRPDDMRVEPYAVSKLYHDGFGNTCTRIEMPAGRTRISAEGVIKDSGSPEPVYPFAQEHPVSLLPEETLMYLLGSRHCETEALMEDAWRRFGHLSPGWGRVQAVCDFAHQHVELGFHVTRPSKTAWQAYTEQRGDSRDIAHLAISLCRCLNIPARYCTGYLSRPGVSAEGALQDFAGWFEAYLGGQWHTFDPVNNQRLAGRILVARGRDAADVAPSTTFGASRLESCRVWAQEIPETPASTSTSSTRSFLDERYGHTM